MIKIHSPGAWAQGGGCEFDEFLAFQNISEFYFPDFMVDIFKIMGFPTFWNYVFHFILAGLGMFLLIKQIGLTNLCSF